MVGYLEYNKFKTHKEDAERHLVKMVNEKGCIVDGVIEHIQVSSPLRPGEPPIFAPIVAAKCNVLPVTNNEYHGF